MSQQRNKLKLIMNSLRHSVKKITKKLIIVKTALGYLDNYILNKWLKLTTKYGNKF